MYLMADRKIRQISCRTVWVGNFDELLQDTVVFDARFPADELTWLSVEVLVIGVEVM